MSTTPDLRFGNGWLIMSIAPLTVAGPYRIDDGPFVTSIRDMRVTSGT